MGERTFDDFGLPAGEGAEPFWRHVVTELFTRMEVDGWDQPHSVWAVLSPSETELLNPEVVEYVRSFMGSGQITTTYAIVGLGMGDNARRLLTLLDLPPGTIAVVLVTESWVSNRLTEDVGMTAREALSALLDARTGGGALDSTENLDAEFQNFIRGDRETWLGPNPDRVEARNATLMQPDGTTWMFTHYRGSDVTDPNTLMNAQDGPASTFAGVLPDLMTRVWGLPLKPMVPLGEILGTTIMVVVDQILQQQPPPINAQTTLLATVEAASILLDSLNTPYSPDPSEPDMVAIFSVRNGPVTAGVRDMIQFGTMGPLLITGRQLANGGWDDFFSRPGASRWLNHDEHGQPLTDDLRAWYGPAHLSRFIQQHLPSWNEARNALLARCGEENFAFVAEVLDTLGWTYAPHSHI